MAKTTDITKIDKIRSAAVYTISRSGVRASSVAMIAKRAGVSAGYLYRYYSGKEELIEDLVTIHFDTINDLISELLGQQHDIDTIIETVVRRLISFGSKDRDMMKFLIMLINDLSLHISPGLKGRIDDLAKELLRRVKNDPRAREGVTEQDIYIALIAVPMQYLALQYNTITGNKFRASDKEEYIVRTALNAILTDI